MDPDLAYMYRIGQKKELNNVLTVEEVFKNFKKGERHTSSSLQKAFGTTDVCADRRADTEERRDTAHHGPEDGRCWRRRGSRSSR